MTEMEQFREDCSLRQSLAAMGKTAAEWIEQSAKERALLLGRIKLLEQIIDNLEAQSVFCDMGDGVDGWKAWAHIPKEEWDANMELWRQYVASRQ